MMHEQPAPSGAPVPVFYEVEEHHPESGTLLGFWLYLMSDCLIFAVLFACYGVLGRSYAAGPSGADLFGLPIVAAQHDDAAAVLHHLWLRHAGNGAGQDRPHAALARHHGPVRPAFVGIELCEFSHMIHEGATPQRSAFLSSFYALVGTHGTARDLRHHLARHADGPGRISAA